MNGRSFDYRGREFAAACLHLLRGKLNYREKIDLIYAIYDKAMRTLKKNRDHLLSNHPEAFGMYRAHYVSLKKTSNELLALKPFLNEGAVIEDVNSYIDSATEDISGIVRACDIILTDDSLGH